MASLAKAAICVWLVVMLSVSPSMQGNNSLTPSGTMCICPGDELRFTCSIFGGGATIWSGSIFDCAENDMITLRHISSIFQAGTFDYCDGAITSEIVGREGDCYISRLNFTAISQFNGTSVECSRQDPQISSVGNSAVFIIPASFYLRELSGVVVSSVDMTEITIRWTEVNSVCSGSISYSVTSSNCSSVTCSYITSNEATCSNLPVASNTMCGLSIRSEVCGQIQTANNVIAVSLRRPRASITPVYSPGSSSVLSRVMITIYPEPFFSVAGDVPSLVTEYSFSYSNGNISIDACQEQKVMCQRSIDADTLACPASTDIVVSLSALNSLGQGPRSDPVSIECTNGFVNVQYDSSKSILTCNFLNERDTSIKSCSIMYGQQCDQMLIRGPQRNSTVDAPNSITLEVESKNLNCYIVTASNDSFTITVEFRASMVTGNARLNAGIILAIIFGIIGGIIAVAITCVIVIVAMVKLRKRREPLIKKDENQKRWEEIIFEGGYRMGQSEEKKRIVEQFELKEVSHKDIKGFDINMNYKLKELSEEVKSDGIAFYQFNGKFEAIPKQAKIIIFDEDVQMLYISNITILKEKQAWLQTLRKIFKRYKIFVENIDSDEEEVLAGTSVLYMVPETESSIEDHTKKATDSEDSKAEYTEF